MSEDHFVYFGYGSNLDPRTFLGRRRMRPEKATCARLDDYRLTFDLAVGSGERGVANLAPQPGARVFGVAYWLSHEDVSRLDRSEGVHRGFYVRRRVLLLSGEEEAIDAFTYISARRASGRRPSRRYIGLLLRGARYHRLPEEYIRELQSTPLAHDEREAGQRSLF